MRELWLCVWVVAAIQVTWAAPAERMGALSKLSSPRGSEDRPVMLRVPDIEVIDSNILKVDDVGDIRNLARNFTRVAHIDAFRVTQTRTQEFRYDFRKAAMINIYVCCTDWANRADYVFEQQFFSFRRYDRRYRTLYVSWPLPPTNEGTERHIDVTLKITMTAQNISTLEVVPRGWGLDRNLCFATVSTIERPRRPSGISAEAKPKFSLLGLLPGAHDA